MVPCLLALEKLLQLAPRDAEGAEDVKKEEVLQHTGTIMEMKDFLKGLEKGGLHEVAKQRLKDSQELIGDAIEELEEWVEGELDPLDHVQKNLPGGPSSEDTGSKGHPDEQDRLMETPADAADLFGMPRACKGEVKPLAEKTVKLLELLKMLFPPLGKRRVGRFPNIDVKTSYGELPDEGMCNRFDVLMGRCKLFSETGDELAEALYVTDLADKESVKRVKDLMQSLGKMAREVLDAVGKSWDGKDDEFTAWSVKWLVKLDELQLDALGFDELKVDN